MATDALSLLNLGGNLYNYLNQKDTTQSNKQNLTNAYSNAKQDVVGYNQPYQQAGLQSLQSQQAMGPFQFTNENFNIDPSYQWRLNQGMTNTQRTAAGKGAFNAGSTLADLTNYAQNAASQEYQNAYNRAQNTYETNWNNLQNITNLGANTARSMSTDLANLALGRAGTVAAMDQQKADQLTSLLSSAGLGTDASMLQSVNSAVRDLFGVDINKASTDMISQGVNYVKSALGIGGAAAGAGALGGLTNAGLQYGASVMPAAAQGATSLANLGLPMTQYGGIAAPGGAIGSSVASDATAAATAANPGMASTIGSFLSSAPGMGAIAAGITLLSGGNIKDAAVTGGLTTAGAYLGSAVLPGVGTAIGAVLGSLASNVIDLGAGYAKADTTMQTTGGTDKFKDGAYSTGPWGSVGFTSGSRHIDVNQPFQQAFNAITMVDTTVSGALTPAENQAMKDYYASGVKYRKESNEGNITPNKIIKSTMKQRQDDLKKVLGVDRYNQLNLDQLYNGVVAGLQGKKKQATAMSMGTTPISLANLGQVGTLGSTGYLPNQATQQPGFFTNT